MALLSKSKMAYFNNRPRQNGRQFADDLFKCIFVNENVWISTKILMNFVPKGPIYNIPADQATSRYLNQYWIDYRRIYASFGLNEFTCKFALIVIKALTGDKIVAHEIPVEPVAT